MTIIQNIKSAFSPESPVAAVEAAPAPEKGVIRAKILAHKAADPSASCAAIGNAVGTSTAYVYQVLNPKPKAAKKVRKAKKVAVVKPEATKLTSSKDALINLLEQSRVELTKELKRLKDDNYLFIQRELKLMGVIDYLEAKVKNGSSV